MKNNKGFSLVELIIVIAIMAILVGVMAPQLIKYIEKTNVSSDTQLADTCKTAITTAMMDPAIVTISGYAQPTSGTVAGGFSAGTASSAFNDAVAESLGCSLGDVNGKLKSKDASGISYDVISSNSVKITVTGSHADAKGGSTPIIVQ